MCKFFLHFYMKFHNFRSKTLAQLPGKNETGLTIGVVYIVRGVLVFLYPLSTLPEHIHSTILSYAKITCKTHKQPKEICFHPSYTRSLVS